MHKCPLCGRLTNRSISDRGANFAICQDCYQREYIDKFKHHKRVESDPKGKGKIYYY